jgi:hypothetical protein
MVLCEIKCYRTIAETNNIENQEYLEKGVGLVRIYLLREGDWVDRYNRYVPANGRRPKSLSPSPPSGSSTGSLRKKGSITGTSGPDQQRAAAPIAGRLPPPLSPSPLAGRIWPHPPGKNGSRVVRGLPAQLDQVERPRHRPAAIPVASRLLHRATAFVWDRRLVRPRRNGTGWFD